MGLCYVSKNISVDEGHDLVRFLFSMQRSIYRDRDFKPCLDRVVVNQYVWKTRNKAAWVLVEENKGIGFTVSANSKEFLKKILM